MTNLGLSKITFT